MFPVYLDENAQDRVLIDLLRRDGVDCLTSNEAGNGALSDSEQLAFAASNGRSVVTLDRADFAALHTEWMNLDRMHAGIIIITSVWVSPAAVRAGIAALQAKRDATQMANAILFIGPTAF